LFAGQDASPKLKTMARKFFPYLLFILPLAFSCKRYADPPEHTVFRYNEAAGISSLDPAFARDLANLWVCNQLYDGLVSLDEKLQIKPAVAHSWQISDDGKTYSFFLRDDVYFHDHEVFEGGKGRRVTAHDFVYSFYRISDPRTASPGAWVFSHVADSGFSAVNDTLFQIRLKYPFMPFPGLLTTQYCNAVPREAVEKYGRDFRSHPIGCGPFQFQYWKEGVKLVLRKNPVYYLFDDDGRRLPYLESVSISFLIDKQSAFLQFIQGKLDFMSGIDASYKDELLTPDGQLHPAYRDRIRLTTQPYLNTEYLGILVDTSQEKLRGNPLADKRIRQAISYGFDRRKMMRFLRNNIGIPGRGGFIPAGMPAFDTGFSYGYSHDPDRASQLLREAGFPDGEGLEAITLTTSAEYLDLCKYIQHELGLLGIPIKISVSPPAAIREMRAQAKIPFFRASWVADYPDEENYLSLFTSTNFCPAGPNYTRFSNALYDSLYTTALGVTDDDARHTIYRAMDSLLMKEAPVVILYYDEVLRFTQNKVRGLGSNPVNLLDLTSVSKEERE